MYSFFGEFQDKILDELKPVLSAISITQDFADDIARVLNETEEKATLAIQKQAEGFRQALKELEQKEDKAIDHFDNGVIDGDQFRRRVKTIRGERDWYERQLEQINLAIHGAAMKTAKKVLELCTNAESLLKKGTKEEIAIHLKQVCSNPILDRASIEYQLQKPFQLITEMKENPLWWR